VAGSAVVDTWDSFVAVRAVHLVVPERVLYGVFKSSRCVLWGYVSGVFMQLPLALLPAAHADDDQLAQQQLLLLLLLLLLYGLVASSPLQLCI
jgi:hypothetical protein